MPRLRIFLSSPADTNWERLRAHLVIRRLARDYRRYFAIEPFLWEYEPMLASQHFQDAIEAPGGFDIVVLMVWSRLGTLLPEKTAVREYRGIDGHAPVTGTEWEFEDALKANRAAGGKGPPDLLVYRRRGGATAVLDDPAGRDEAIRQYDALEAFWRRWFKDDTGFLAGFTWYDDPSTFDHRLEADLRTLIERRIKERHVVPAASVWLTNSPFRGLRAYEFEDAPVFFGRHGQTGDGLTRLLDAAQRGTAFLLVSGPSGSGKSSLARAGLLPALLTPKMVSGVGLWRRAVMRPGDAGGDPILALVRALATDPAEEGVGLPELAGKRMTGDELTRYLASGNDPKPLFAMILHALADAERARHGLLPHEQARLVLLVDQLEELVTRPEVTAEQRSQFARAVAAVADSGAVWVIATVRSDLWHRLEEVKELRDLAERGARLALAAPDAAQLFDIIRKPAQAAGFAFDTEPGTELTLDAVVAREAEAQPGVLPLLSVMLDELYERDVAHGGGTLLTVASYRALGGLRAAIGERAESRLQDIQNTDPAAAAALPRLLRALVTVTALADTPAARSAPLTTFAEASAERRLVDALIDARLLTAEDRGHGPEVQLAHEALVENWPRAKAIVAESGRFVRLRDDIDIQRRRWEAAQRRPELLLAGGLPLAEARDLVKRFGAELSPDLLAFISASRRRSRSRQELAAAATVLIMAMAGYGVWWWDQNLRIKTGYCANYGERWAVPFCVGPLDAATQAARQTSYRFRLQGGRVQELARVNGAGALTDSDDELDEPWTKGVAQWFFSYAGDAYGAAPVLASVTMQGSNGVLLRKVSYEFSPDHQEAVVRPESKFDVIEGQTAAGNALGLGSYGVADILRSTKSMIGRHHLSFDAAGLLLVREYRLDRGDGTVANAVGSHGRIYTYGRAGLLTSVHNLDGQGNVLVETGGIAGQVFDYDERGDRVSGEWVGHDGLLRANQKGFARYVVTRDSTGNAVGLAFYGESGAPIERSDSGVARASVTYDERGNQLEVAVFAADGNPVLTKDEGAARAVFRYNDHGYRIEQAYFGTDGRPVLSKSNGIARAAFHYDAQGNVRESAYFAADGRPILDKKTLVARVIFGVNERGMLAERSYFGTDGMPLANRQGSARDTISYDGHGNQAEWAYFGVDRKPALNRDIGAARVAFRYDDSGNMVEMLYFGADRAPVRGTRGYARLTQKYDDRGNVIEIATFDIDGKLVATPEGVARQAARHDDRGNMVEQRFFGADGSPVVSRLGHTHDIYRYDERGNMIEWRGFGPDEKPMANSDGIARRTFVYNDRGERLEQMNFGSDGTPTLNKEDGVARVTQRYDSRGNVEEEAYFGVDGKRVLDKKHGIARAVIHHDQRGNVVEQAFFDTDGNPVRSKDGDAHDVLTWDERDNKVEEAYFGPDGTPALIRGEFARMTRRFDDRGNQVEEAYFGIDGTPALVRGVARITRRYDNRGDLVEETDYFGIDRTHGRPLWHKIGVPVAKARFSFNSAGEQTNVTYLDEHGDVISIEVECRGVSPGGIAAGIGLASGDRLIAYDGEALRSVPQLVQAVGHAEAGPHKLTVRRGVVTTTYDVPPGKLGVIPADVAAETAPLDRSVPTAR